MYTIKPTTKFQKDLKRASKRGYNINILLEIIKKLAAGEELPAKNCDHALSGIYSGCSSPFQVHDFWKMGASF